MQSVDPATVHGIDVAITNLASSLPLTGDGKVKIIALPQSERFEGAQTIIKSGDIKLE